MLVFVSPCSLSNLKRIAAIFFTESWFAFASAHNADFLKELGADEVIDYNTQKFEDVVSDIDVVFNATPTTTVDEELRLRSVQVLKEDGIFVCTRSLSEKLGIHQIIYKPK